MHVTWWRVRMATVATETRKCVVHSSATRRSQEYKYVQYFHVKQQLGSTYTTELQNTGLFISPSEISDPCGTVAGMVMPKGSMSTEGETLHVC
jgi:hypothetical protein